MTQAEKVLEALRRGERLTPLTALHKYKVGRLAARAWDLRQAGVKVLKTMVEVSDGVRVASYYLPAGKGRKAA